MGRKKLWQLEYLALKLSGIKKKKNREKYINEADPCKLDKFESIHWDTKNADVPGSE